MNATIEFQTQGYTVNTFQFLENPVTTCTLAPFEVIEMDAGMEAIPDSFFQGLADINAGRIVDVDRAHREPPPGQ